MNTEISPTLKLTFGNFQLFPSVFTLFLNNSTFSPLFPQWERKYMNKQWIWTLCWVFIVETCSRYPSYPSYPSQGTQVMLTQDKETKKVWTLQPKPSQRSSLRSLGKVQECSLTQWLHNPISCTCAALQQQRSSTEEQWAASAAGKLRSISLVCRLHNTITLHLTAVRSSARASVKSKLTSKSKVLVNIHVIH